MIIIPLNQLIAYFLKMNNNCINNLIRVQTFMKTNVSFITMIITLKFIFIIKKQL